MSSEEKRHKCHLDWFIKITVIRIFILKISYTVQPLSENSQIEDVST